MQEFNWFSRRDFLKGLGLTSLALATGACESCYNKIKNRPTRRNIANLAANDPIIQTYKDAVTAMKALPASDGRNWTKQAEIHNNHCTHGNWWFLPWHRAYLFNFEAICRKLTGNNDFALPYWNWTTTPSIPAPFWGAGNPLLNSTRFATQSSTVNSSVCGASNITTNVLAETNFLLFASAQGRRKTRISVTARSKAGHTTTFTVLSVETWAVICRRSIPCSGAITTWSSVCGSTGTSTSRTRTRTIQT